MDLVCDVRGTRVLWGISTCHWDWVNIIAALFSMYIIIIIIGFLRWNHAPRKLVLQVRIFKGHNARVVAGILLFLVHLTELSESLLAESPPSHILSVPTASLAFFLLAFLLERLLETCSKRQYLPVTSFLWLVAGVTRSLRLAAYLNSGLDIACLTPCTAATAAVLCYFITVSQIVAARSGLNQTEVQFELPGKGYRHDSAHFLSKVTFHWLTPLLKNGYTTPLEMVDLGKLPDRHTTKNQFAQFGAILERNVPDNRHATSLALWRCFWYFMKHDFCLGGVLKLFGDLAGLVGPLGIAIIVNYVSRAQNPPAPVHHPTVWDFLHNGWCMAVVVLVASVVQSSFSQASTHLVNVRAIHLKAAIQTLIYTRTLTLRNQAGSKDLSDNKTDTDSADAEVGNIAHLVSEDAFNVMTCFWVGHYTWAIPLKISILLYLLYQKLGPSALIGAAVTIFTVTPLQFLIGKKMSRNASAVSEKSDERLQQINTLLRGIKLLKMLGWEQFCCEKILKVRKEETTVLDEDSLYWAVLTFLTHASSIMVTLVTFGAYNFLEDGPLAPESVFSALALFNQLTVPLSIFPVTVPIFISAMVSTTRLSEFLSTTQSPPKTGPPESPEGPVFPDSDKTKDTQQTPRQRFSFSSIRPTFGDVKSWIMQSEFSDPELSLEMGNMEDLAETEEVSETAVAAGSSNNSPQDSEGWAVKVQEGQFGWTRDAAEESLYVSSMTVPYGTLTMVVGKVGSGKTSLLSAVLGEMYQRSGEKTWKKDTLVAYAPQNPWMINATVRDNILFGQPFRPRRYLQVLAACALQPDMDILPGKDLTEIGERGIRLSGGQKQRIAIARVLYSKANMVIMDDPLSSLDYAVALKVFEDGIKRLVRREKRSVILATHHIQLLPHAHMIIAMEDGKIRVQGQINDIELEDREIVQTWREMMLRTDTNLQGRTAKERWRLIRLVARIGRELRPCGVADGSWQAEDGGMMPNMSSSIRRRFQKFSKWKYITHDLPLPTDECEGDVLEARAHWRKTTPSVKRRTILRASSLQTRHVRVPLVARQHSSPLITTRPQNSGSHRGFLRQIFSRPSQSSSESLSMEVPSKKPVDRLLSTESGFSDAGSEVDADELDDMDYNLGGKAAEDRQYGQIPGTVYGVYLRACGLRYAVVYLVVTLSWQALRVTTDFWLSKWTNIPLESEMNYYLYVYGALSLGSVVLSFASHGVGQYAGAQARAHLHQAMLLNIVRCPLKLFESTPAGRMFNRFSTDVSLIDKKISTSIQRLMQFLLLCGSAILVNAAVAPWFVVVAIPVCLVYYIVQQFYRTSSRELQRLDSITRTPIFSHLTETMGGLTTIRAFGYESKFTANFYTKIDTHTNAFLIMNSGDRWLGIVLDYLGGIIVFLAIITSLISATTSTDRVSPSLIGLAINYTLLVPIYLNWVVKFLADCEVYMGAVERVHQYALHANEEYEPHTDVNIPEDWPSKGEILFDNVCLSYGFGKEPVVSGLNLRVTAGQKVGICGRSGSGKSSLALSLFNMLEVTEGSISIDNIDITAVPLLRLRTSISIIPQDALLLNTTLRENLDPRGEYSDEELWEALDKAQLKAAVQAQWMSLDEEVKEGGHGLSGGQKQLFCLARAILHGSAFLVMDEATSNLDPESEHELMASVKKAFCGKTILIIAHRLSTILDCDWIVVLDNGRVVEEGTPTQLLNKNLGIFSTMLRSAEETAFI